MFAKTPAHILIVEDDPGIATSLRSDLEREGYQVTWVDKGVTASPLPKTKLQI
jgi:DNA-binding response OmpR family regulator